MENKENKTSKTQGVTEVTRKVGKASTLKSFGVLIKNVEEAKLLNKEDTLELKKLHEKAVKQYLGYSIEV